MTNEIQPALEQFTKAASQKIEGALQLVEALKTEQAKTSARLLDLEQNHVSAAGICDSDSFSSGASSGIGQLVLKSLDVDGLRSNVARSTRAGLQGFFAKAAITSTGYPVQAQRDPAIYGALPAPVSVRDLLPIQKTAAGAIEFVRGSRTGAAAIQAVEGDVKAELAASMSLHTAQVRTIATWVPASRQVLDDVAALSGFIDLELRDALRLAEDAQLLTGDGTGSNIHGLMVQASAYTRGKTGDAANDTLRRAITQVQIARGSATGIVVSPQSLERLELERDKQGRYLATFDVTDANGRTVAWRVPVVVSTAIAENAFLVGDFSRAAKLYDRQEATVEIATQHADFFTRNMVAILAEERLALAVMRPDLLVAGEFSAP